MNVIRQHLMYVNVYCNKLASFTIFNLLNKLTYSVVSLSMYQTGVFQYTSMYQQAYFSIPRCSIKLAYFSICIQLNWRISVSLSNYLAYFSMSKMYQSGVFQYLFQ